MSLDFRLFCEPGSLYLDENNWKLHFSEPVGFDVLEELLFH